jgi:dihydroorotate dehydrogenase (fumarate)
VLFNRFYQPDIDPERLEATWRLTLTDSSELGLRLHWIAILAGRVKASLGITGGVHGTIDAVKAIMAGADGVQLVSELIGLGPVRLQMIQQEFAEWATEHGYISVSQMQGLASQRQSRDPAVFQRGNYVRLLQAAQKTGVLIEQSGG